MLADARHRRLEDRIRTMTTHPVTRHPAARAGAAVAALAAIAAGVAIPLSGLSSARGNEELVRNGGFEKGLRGWSQLDRSQTLSLTRDAHTGRFAAAIKARSAGVIALRDSPNTVRDTPQDAVYRASAWVKTDQPGLAVSLRLREVKQDFLPHTKVRVLVRKQTADTVLRDTAWHRLSIVYKAAPGHQLDLGVFAWNAAAGRTLTVDDVSMSMAGDDDGGRTSSAPAPTTSAPTTSAPTTPAPTASGPGSESPAPTTTGPDPTASTTSPAPTTTSPEPTQTTPVPVGDTLFGFSAYQESGESWTAAVARRDRGLGSAHVIRAFYPGLPQAWPGRAGEVDRDVIVSFKAPPAEINAGTDDDRLRAWFASAPTDRTIYWSYFHEPEDDIERGSFTAAQYRAAWTRIAAIADSVKKPNLKATLILMAWSVNKASGRTWTDYYPGNDVIDVIGWDAYNQAAYAKTPSYNTPAAIYDPPAAAARSVGKPFGFAEWGSVLLPGDDGADRAAWIRASTAYQAKIGSVFSTYFDSIVGGDFRLNDAASQNALRSAIDAD